MSPLVRSQDERGAVLVHAAILLLALTAFSALVIDLGVMFVSRGQAQNAADAGALAAATSLAFGAIGDLAVAQGSAIATAQQNLVWGESPGVTANDVAFSPALPCPPGASGVGTCVRVNVFRTSYEGGGGTPLPTFFANIVGVGEQGTRATATAQMVASAGTADCVKPWAIPDRWSPWPTPTYVSGSNAYSPPNPLGPGTGYQLPDDLGSPLTLTLGIAGAPARPDHFYPVVISPLLPYLDAIEQCATAPITAGMLLNYEAGAGAALTPTAVSTLIARDPTATWDPVAYLGRGAPRGGCMADGTCSRSPRLIALPLFDPNVYDTGPRASMILRVTNIIGFWIESVVGANVAGYITAYPTVSLTGPVFTERSSFARTVVLVR
jgi:hypothetical protein